EGSICLVCALGSFARVALFQDGFQLSEFLRALHLEELKVFFRRFELDGHDEDLLAFLALVALPGHETHVGIDLNAEAIGADTKRSHWGTRIGHNAHGLSMSHAFVPSKQCV
ncbi:MAG: hypothetical protein VX365_04780, partial [Candidatus Thermoplasmatota archaeon]